MRRQETREETTETVLVTFRFMTGLHNNLFTKVIVKYNTNQMSCFFLHLHLCLSGSAGVTDELSLQFSLMFFPFFSIVFSLLDDFFRGTGRQSSESVVSLNMKE